MPYRVVGLDTALPAGDLNIHHAAVLGAGWNGYLKVIVCRRPRVHFSFSDSLWLSSFRFFEDLCPVEKNGGIVCASTVSKTVGVSPGSRDRRLSQLGPRRHARSLQGAGPAPAA